MKQNNNLFTSKFFRREAFPPRLRGNIKTVLKIIQWLKSFLIEI